MIDRDRRIRNLSLVGVVAATILFTAHHEGYLAMISLPFWGILITGFALLTWLALTASTARLLSLLLTVFAIEFIKEATGIHYGLWVYHGPDGAFVFGVWAWVLGGVSCYVLATRVVAPAVRGLLPPWFGRLNPLLVIGLAALGVALLGPRARELGGQFWILYALLLLIGLLRSRSIEASTLTALVLTSWAVGNASEYLGSVHSGVWTFPGHPGYPPLFLLFACWPVEILSQYSLATYFVPDHDADAAPAQGGE